MNSSSMDSEFVVVEFIIKYAGDEADRNQLSFYDGAESLFGFSKALLLVSHYAVNEKVTFQAPAVKGVRAYMLPARAGSFEQVIQVVIENKEFLMGVGAATAKDILKDGVKFVFKRVSGSVAKASTGLWKRVFADKEGDLEALGEAVERPLADAHRTINSDRAKITISSDSAELARFDSDTKAYISSRSKVDHIERIDVNIASYNINNRSGRLYDPDLGRTVPFSIASKSKNTNTRPLTWSLDQRNAGLEGTIRVSVQRIVTLKNETKKYIVHDCQRIDGQQ